MLLHLLPLGQKPKV